MRLFFRTGTPFQLAIRGAGWAVEAPAPHSPFIGCSRRAAFGWRMRTLPPERGRGHTCGRAGTPRRASGARRSCLPRIFPFLGGQCARPRVPRGRASATPNPHPRPCPPAPCQKKKAHLVCLQRAPSHRRDGRAWCPARAPGAFRVITPARQAGRQGPAAGQHALRPRAGLDDTIPAGRGVELDVHVSGKARCGRQRCRRFRVFHPSLENGPRGAPVLGTGSVGM
jgi:hypothetical protein